MASPINTIRVIIFYVIMTISAFLGVIFIQTPSIPFAFLNRRLYFRWCSRAIGHYLLMVTVNSFSIHYFQFYDFDFSVSLKIYWV